MAEGEDKVAAYREAWEAWQRQLEPLHAFFLEKQRIDPLRLKGVLNREARAKQRYDRARLRLLGVEDDSSLIDASEDDEEEEA